MRITRRKPQMTRQRIADPHLDVSFARLLKQARCLDLRNNWRIQDLGGGYATVHPIDRTRRWGDMECDCRGG